MDEDLDTDTMSCDNEDSGYVPELNIGSISVGQETRNVNIVRCREWTEQVALNGKRVVCKIDTGAECNVISNVVLKSIMQKPKIKASKVRLKAYGGTPISSLGTIELECEVNGCKVKSEFYVVALSLFSVVALSLFSVVALSLFFRVMISTAYD